MPFLSYQISVPDAVANAGRLVKEGGAQAVKIEGGRQFLNTVGALPNPDNITSLFEFPNVDDVECLVEKHLLADLQLLDFDIRLGGNPQFSVAGRHINRSIDVHLQHGAEVVGRCCELVHFLSEDTQLLPCFLEDCGQFVVLGGGSLQALLGLVEIGFELANLFRSA
jgi:hypothetical protein